MKLLHDKTAQLAFIIMILVGTLFGIVLVQRSTDIRNQAAGPQCEGTIGRCIVDNPQLYNPFRFVVLDQTGQQIAYRTVSQGVVEFDAEFGKTYECKTISDSPDNSQPECEKSVFGSTPLCTGPTATPVVPSDGPTPTPIIPSESPTQTPTPSEGPTPTPVVVTVTPTATPVPKTPTPEACPVTDEDGQLFLMPEPLPSNTASSQCFLEREWLCRVPDELLSKLIGQRYRLAVYVGGSRVATGQQNTRDLRFTAQNNTNYVCKLEIIDENGEIEQSCLEMTGSHTCEYVTQQASCPQSDGDLNNNGRLDISDIELLRQASVNETAGIDADITCDGTVNSLDWSKLIQLYSAQ